MKFLSRFLLLTALVLPGQYASAALTATLEGVAELTSSISDTFTTESKTVASGEYLLMVCASWGGAARTIDSIAIDAAGFSLDAPFAKIAAATSTQTGDGNMEIAIFEAVVDAGGSDTMTVTMSGNTSVRGCALYRITEFDTDTEYAQADAENATTSTTPSGTLTSTPASGAVLIAGIMAAQDSGTASETIEAGSGYTEDDEAVAGGLMFQVQQAAGSNGTTYAWSGLPSGSPATTISAFNAIEVSAAAASGSTVPIFTRRLLDGAE